MNLVTGGTGLVGTHILYSLVLGGEEIRAIKRPTSNLEWVKRVFHYYRPKEWEHLYQKIQWVDADLADQDALEDTLKDVRRIFHSAAVVSFDPRDKNKMMRVNRDGTRLLVNLALERDVDYFGYISSVAALGMRYSDGIYVVSENEPWKTSDDKPDYAVSKFMGELEVWRGIEEGLSAGIVNPTVVLGPGDWYRGSGALFRRLARGLAFYPIGNTGFVDVRDVVSVLLWMADNRIKGERYLVSAGDVSYFDFFSRVSKAFGRRVPKYAVTPFAGNLALIGDAIISRITGKPAEITKHTLRAGRRKIHYDTSKLERDYPGNLIPVSESVQNAVGFYRGLINKGASKIRSSYP